eukprot:gb/GEZN01015508.1/.p1 GENE.gb/GEZN01015508.1/~~gb/GEZN01015508.1/.p1  ORF type:complete len:223 (+),score=28.38 gb/GEZN01015508.1/:84-671(+)
MACGCAWKSAAHARSQSLAAVQKKQEEDRQRPTSVKVSSALHKVQKSVSLGAESLLKGSSQRDTSSHRRFSAPSTGTLQRAGSGGSLNGSRAGSMSSHGSRGDSRGDSHVSRGDSGHRELPISKIVIIEGRKVRCTDSSFAFMLHSNNAQCLVDEEGCDIYDFHLVDNVGSSYSFRKKEGSNKEEHGTNPGGMAA